MNSSSLIVDYLFKYIIIGDSSVGKSSILLRYTEGGFREEYSATIGVEFGAKNINIKDKIYRVQIWDTAGQENFRSITRSYYKNSVCALIVYDISSKESFNNISKWMSDCKNQSPKNILMILIGNKMDLIEKREVTYEEGKEFADKNDMLFFETSAKTGNNIDNVFYDSASNIVQKMENGFYDLSDVSCGIKKSVNNENPQVKIEDRVNNKEKKINCC